MDFSLPPALDDIRLRTRAFVADHILPLEQDPVARDEHENIAEPALWRAFVRWRRPRVCGVRRCR
jgi:acyl-CoA dehydrogenase